MARGQVGLRLWNIKFSEHSLRWSCVSHSPLRNHKAARCNPKQDCALSCACRAHCELCTAQVTQRRCTPTAGLEEEACPNHTDRC